MAHVLDASMYTTTLAEKGYALMGSEWRQPQVHLCGLTYQDIHLQPLVFAPSTLLRPLR